jgi:hypothetical protein
VVTGKPLNLKGGGDAEKLKRSFKEVVVDNRVVQRKGKAPTKDKDGGSGCSEVVWEVEAEALAKLNGSFVGFFSEEKEPKAIQHDFIMDGDDRNFYGIFSVGISNKMTKTCPKTKENLQNHRKASKQSQEYKKTRKSQKSKKMC